MIVYIIDNLYQREKLNSVIIWLTSGSNLFLPFLSFYRDNREPKVNVSYLYTCN